MSAILYIALQRYDVDLSGVLHAMEAVAVGTLLAAAFAWDAQIAGAPGVFEGVLGIMLACQALAVRIHVFCMALLLLSSRETQFGLV